MNTHISRRTLGLVIVAAVALTAGQVWAIFFPLGPSKDEWGLKYSVEVTAVGEEMVDIAFVLADEGRLKPVHSYTVVALSKPKGDGGRSYDVKAPLTLTTTADGQRAGQVRIPRRFFNQAVIRILTLNVNGKRQTAGAALYDIPLDRYTIKNPTPTATPAPATPSVAAPPATKVIK